MTDSTDSTDSTPSLLRPWVCARCKYASAVAITPDDTEPAIRARVVASHDVVCPPDYCAGYLDAFSRPRDVREHS